MYSRTRTSRRTLQNNNGLNYRIQWLHVEIQPAGHFFIVVFRKQILKTSLWEFYREREQQSSYGFKKGLHIFHTHAHSFNQNTKETSELSKQEKGKWEVRISAVVFADVRVQVAWSLIHTSEISTSTSTSKNARHTHAQKWFGSWMTDSARAYAWRLCSCLCLSH